MISTTNIVRRNLFVAVFVFLSGCLSIPTQDVRVAYIGDFDPYAASGDSTIEGQAFLRQQGGGVVLCAGEEALLFPDKGFFTEGYRLAKSGTRPVPNGDKSKSISQIAVSDPTYAKVVRKSRCDAQGNFTFANIPSGDWIVFSTVRWIVSDIPQGSTLATTVSIQNGETKRVLLSDADRI